MSWNCIFMQLQDDETEAVRALNLAVFPKHNGCTAGQYYSFGSSCFHLNTGSFPPYLSVKSFLLRTDYRGLKFVFDMSKTTIPALQRYELITDGY